MAHHLPFVARWLLPRKTGHSSTLDMGCFFPDFCMFSYSPYEGIICVVRAFLFFIIVILSWPVKAAILPKWERVVAPLAGLPIVRGRARDDWLIVIAQVNQEINTVPYVPEYGADVWQAPKQFYANGGDCEDFAIAKYYRLRREGYRERDMRVTIVRDRRTQEIHAFLALWLNGALIILDNRQNELLPGERIKDFDVFYSVNRLGFYVPRGRDILPR